MPHLVSAVEFARSKPVVALLALTTHYILHNGEWDNDFHVFLGVWLVAFSGLATAEYASDSRANTIDAVMKTTASAGIVYFSVLVTSILLHRGFFHRLNKVRERLASTFVISCD
jgi:hypothetical protein